MTPEAEELSLFNVLVLTSRQKELEHYKSLFNDFKIRSCCALDFDSAKTILLEDNTINLIFLDVSFTDYLSELKQVRPAANIFIATSVSEEELDAADSALKNGAYFYIIKNIRDGKPHIRTQRLREALLSLKYNSTETLVMNPHFPDFKSASLDFVTLREKIDFLSATIHTVLIQGEKGSGKTLLAKMFFEEKLRNLGEELDFSCVDAKTITSIASEVKKCGHGVLLIENVHQMPSHLQQELNQALEEKNENELDGYRSFQLIMTDQRAISFIE